MHAISWLSLFFRGHPSNDLLPSIEVAAAAQNVLLTPRETDADETTRHPLTYGADEGGLEVRRSFAKWTNKRLGTTAGPENLNLTNGASFGAASALAQCCPRDYTQATFSVSPTYFLMNSIFADAGFSTKSHAVVELPGAGLDFDRFEKELEQLPPAPMKIHGKYRVVMYLVPQFSNPGGYTLTYEERLRLLFLARKYDILLLCDEIYNLLNFDPSAAPEPLLVTLDRETVEDGSWGNVIANFSVSKYLGPGLRVGWQEATTPELAYHLSQYGATRSGGSPAQMNTFLVQDIIESGVADKIIAKLCSIYSERSVSYLEAMKKYLPPRTLITGGDGGYFFWVTLPDGYDVAAITAECRSHGIVLAPGNHFEVEGSNTSGFSPFQGWGKHCFRVSLSYHTTEEALPAIELWGQICAKHFVVR